MIFFFKALLFDHESILNRPRPDMLYIMLRLKLLIAWSPRTSLRPSPYVNAANIWYINVSKFVLTPSITLVSSQYHYKARLKNDLKLIVARIYSSQSLLDTLRVTLGLRSLRVSSGVGINVVDLLKGGPGLVALPL